MPLKCADGVSRRARGELERRLGVWGWLLARCSKFEVPRACRMTGLRPRTKELDILQVWWQNDRFGGRFSEL